RHRAREVALANRLRVDVGGLVLPGGLLRGARRLRDQPHALGVAGLGVRDDLDSRRRETGVDQLVLDDVRAIVRPLARVGLIAVGEAFDDDRLVGVNERARDRLHLLIAGRDALLLALALGALCFLLGGLGVGRLF